MNNYNNDDKKVRRIAAIIYLLVMAFLVGGTLIHQRSLEGGDSLEVTDLSDAPGY